MENKGMNLDKRFIRHYPQEFYIDGRCVIINTPVQGFVNHSPEKFNFIFFGVMLN